MNHYYREGLNILFSLIVIALTIFIGHQFFLPLAWAGIIAIVTWPLYQRVERYCGQQKTLAALLLTGLLTLTIALPLLYIMKLIVSETHAFTQFIIIANREGITAPHWLQSVPIVGPTLTIAWQNSLGTPHAVTTAFTSEAHHSLKLISDFIKKFGLQIVHRTFVFGFTLMCLFFFYRDGRTLTQQINSLGEYCLGDRWQTYATKIPIAISATVNGIVMVGILIGILMGICYAIAGLPAPALLGAITALFAMVPFAIVFLLGFIFLILAAQGKLFTALSLVIIGTLLMFISDHFIRPFLIKGSTRLHFLAVLFGILGGVETMGIIGLFIGPVIMILFVTLWHEPAVFNQHP